MNQHPELIADAEGIATIADALKSESIIAFDTEFIREKTFYPILEIIQIATAHDAWLIDAKALMAMGQDERQATCAPLFDVLEHPDIIKVVHAAHGDQECLYHCLGMLAKPIFDTSLAGALCGYGDNAGLYHLLDAVLGVRLKKGHARTKWSMRPLPKQLLEYALADVIHLVELGQSLLDELDSLGRRDWAFEYSREFESPRAYESNPKTIAMKLTKSGRVSAKDYPILLELIRWREAYVSEINIPRKWFVDDALLVNLAVTRPKTMDHLKTFRGLNAKGLDKYGEHLLALIERGAQAPIPDIQLYRPPKLPDDKSSVLIKCFVAILAKKYRIVPRFLIDTKDYVSLMRESFESVDELIAAGVLSKPAAELIGDELIHFLHGKSALTLQDGYTILIETNQDESITIS